MKLIPQKIPKEIKESKSLKKFAKQYFIALKFIISAVLILGAVIAFLGGIANGVINFWTIFMPLFVYAPAGIAMFIVTLDETETLQK